MNKITTTQPRQETPEPKVGQIWEHIGTQNFYLLAKHTNIDGEEPCYALVNLVNSRVYHLPWEPAIDEVFCGFRKNFRLASAPITITPNLPDT